MPSEGTYGGYNVIFVDMYYDVETENDSVQWKIN